MENPQILLNTLLLLALYLY